MVTSENERMYFNLDLLLKDPEFLEWLRYPKIEFKPLWKSEEDNKEEIKTIHFEPHESYKVLSDEEEKKLEEEYEILKAKCLKALGGITEAGQSNA